MLGLEVDSQQFFATVNIFLKTISTRAFTNSIFCVEHQSVLGTVPANNQPETLIPKPDW
jgi:hypothetical protein